MKIIIYGINGKMGAATLAAAQASDAEVVCGIDKSPCKLGAVPVYSALTEFGGKADVIIDFSRPETLDDILGYSVKTGTAIVLCTTGYDTNQMRAIESAAQKTRILRSANMSLGVNVAAKLARDAFHALCGFDVEIIEKHHNQKVDAPSGTALLLADAMESGKPYIYGREGKTGARGNEIGIHAVRGGTIVGEHEIIFAGDDEIITISHTALSRKVFANGAVAAARFLTTVSTNGMYSMDDVIKQ